MKELVKQLNLTLNWEMDGVYAFENDDLYVQFINPHEGTNFEYVIRAEFKEDFDRWSNCVYETYSTDLEKDLSEIISDLKELKKTGMKTIVITGVSYEKDSTGVIIAENDEISYYRHEKLPSTILYHLLL